MKLLLCISMMGIGILIELSAFRCKYNWLLDNPVVEIAVQLLVLLFDVVIVERVQVQFYGVVIFQAGR